MTLDDLITPIDDHALCGPDLDATVDPDFDAYYFGALGRLPSFFFRPGVERPDDTRSPDQMFDSNTITLSEETGPINALLARSRDLRLLVLRAQWEILAGQLGPCSESFEAIAALLETFADAVHPHLPDNLKDRRDALTDLNAQITMVQPLQFYGLTGTNETSLRKMRVAKGLATPLASEEDLDLAQMENALKDPGVATRVDQTYADLARMSDALARMTRVCKNHPDSPFNPALDEVERTVADMRDAITSARPDLQAVEQLPLEGTDPTNMGAENTGDVAASEGDGSATSPGQAHAIENHAHARAILQRCEQYYNSAEPSSAVLLLVTQARLLIGRPLVEAMEALLPQKMNEAIVDFGPKHGFSLNYDRLRQLTETASAPENPDDANAPHPNVDKIATAADAAAAIRAVEDYFRKVEISSPVPVLLQRARSYVGRDFQSLIDELMPNPPPE